MKYFITESNFKKVYREFDADSDDIKYIEEILKKDICKLFGKNEITIISSAKAAIESMQDLETLKIRLKKLKPLKKVKDDPRTRFIFLAASPAYHTSKLCPRLHSQYKNYEIPAAIRDENIIEYRTFFLENIELYESKRDIFFARVETKFNVKIQLINEIEKPNSGAEIFLELDTEKENIILGKIFHLGNDMVQFKFSSEERRVAIQKYGLTSHRIVKKDANIPISDESFRIIKTWYEYKIKMKDYVTKYLLAKFNPDLAFNQKCLDELGFKPCYDCTNQSKNDVDL